MIEVLVFCILATVFALPLYDGWITWRHNRKPKPNVGVGTVLTNQYKIEVRVTKRWLSHVDSHQMGWIGVEHEGRERHIPLDLRDWR